jgi:hypothetical protein
MLVLSRTAMDLRALLASVLISGSALAQSDLCPPLTAWPRAPYAVHGDILEHDRGLEARVLAESEKLPGVYREVLVRHSPRALMVFTHDPPSAVDRFAHLDPDTLTTAGTRIEDSAAFVSIDQMNGYYNPLRIARGSVSANVYLHEYGHLLYEALGIPGSELSERFDEVSQALQEDLEPYYPRLDRSDESYKHVMLHEAFAEAIARMYHKSATRRYFEEDHPDLTAFMLSLENRAIMILDTVHAFGFAERCRTAYIYNPPGWRPQTLLNAPEPPR